MKMGWGGQITWKMCQESSGIDEGVDLGTPNFRSQKFFFRESENFFLDLDV